MLSFLLPVQNLQFMTNNYLKTLLIALAVFGMNFTATAQCLDWVAPSPTTGWVDFNNSFGGAPCDDGTGCPFNELTAFEVWASEAYTVDNFVAGGSYAFSMCNGTGGTAWVAEFTIIAPSGAVDAFGAGDGDGCTISWTCSESGSYLIVINEAGECGGGPNQGTSNGFPALTCVTSPETTCPVPETGCYAGDLQTTGTVAVCPGGTFDLESINDTIPNDPTQGGYTWQFSDGLGGTGGLAGGFTIVNSSPMETWDNDLNGILSSNGLDVLQGMWVIHGAIDPDITDPNDDPCSITADSLIVDFSDLSIASLTDNADMSATVVAAGGTMPYGYMWSDGQTTETATGLMNGTIVYVTVSDANGCEAVDSLLMGSICDAGTMTTIGMIDVACPNDTFDLAADSPSLPLNAGYGWYFDNSLGGTGALDGLFVLTGIDLPPSSTYDNDLNGILSGNGLPPFAGTWIVKGAVYEDVNDAFNTICSFTGDSLIVNFADSFISATAVDNGDLTATATGTGGTEPYTYMWDDGQTTETATGLMDGQTISVTITDANGCEAVATVTIVEFICETGELVTTGDLLLCDDQIEVLQNDGNHMAPATGGFGWVFDPSLGGTGALDQQFILFGIADPADDLIDRDLGGLLSANGLPFFAGTWVIKGAVYSDTNDPFVTICMLTADSLTVTFSDSPTASATDNGDGTATASGTGGATPYTYVWSDGQTTETAVDLVTGTYTVTVTEANGCTGEASVDVMTIAVDNIASLEHVQVSPNPTSGFFRVDLALNTTEDVSLQVLDLVGRTVQSFAAAPVTDKVYEVNLENQAQGVYLIRLNIGDKVLMRRVVVSK